MAVCVGTIQNIRTNSRGYFGFIAPDDGQTDLHFFDRDVEEEAPLSPGERVSFSVATAGAKVHAVGVRRTGEGPRAPRQFAAVDSKPRAGTVQTVKSNTKGYFGFIQPDDGTPALHFFDRDVEGANQLTPGDRVTFVAQGGPKPHASSIRCTGAAAPQVRVAGTVASIRTNNRGYYGFITPAAGQQDLHFFDRDVAESAPLVAGERVSFVAVSGTKPHAASIRRAK